MHDRDTMVRTVAHDDITLRNNGERIMDAVTCSSEPALPQIGRYRKERFT